MEYGDVYLAALNLVLAILNTWASALIASAKGRNPAVWALVGWFLPVIGIVLVACLPDLQKGPDYRALILRGFRSGFTSGSPTEDDTARAVAPGPEEPET